MATVEEIKSKVMIEVATDPISLVPFLIGTTGLLGMFAFKAFSIAVFGVFGGLAVWGVASAWTRFFTSKAVAQRVEKAISEEQARKHEEEIENLRANLSGQPSSLLEDILGLQLLIKSLPTDSVTASGLVVSSKALLDQSIANLKQVSSLDEIYSSTRGDATKKVIKSKRDKIISETKENVEFIGKILSDLQDSSSAYSLSNQESTRQELLNRIEDAKTVDQQMAEINLSLMSKKVPA